MAEVFIARRRKLDEGEATTELDLPRAAAGSEGAPVGRIVLKRIRPDLAESDEYYRRFVLEAQVLSRLSHPNLVRFYEFGKVGQCHFIVMELVRGYSLNRLLERVINEAQPPPLEVAVHIAQGILDGLGAMHAVRDDEGRSRPMVHRDVTPTNVIITRDGRPVLIDLGIAKDLLGPQITLPGRVIGTARYMAPEHRKAEFIDARADVFSASVILFELLFGRHPWKPLDSLKELLRTTFDPPEISAAARARVPAEVVDVVMRGLACEPQDRFSSADEMAHALAACATIARDEAVRRTRAWARSLGLPTDDDLDSPVLDHGPKGEDEEIVWNEHGALSREASRPPASIMPGAAMAPLPDEEAPTILDLARPQLPRGSAVRAAVPSPPPVNRPPWPPDPATSPPQFVARPQPSGLGPRPAVGASSLEFGAAPQGRGASSSPPPPPPPPATQPPRRTSIRASSISPRPVEVPPIAAGAEHAPAAPGIDGAWINLEIPPLPPPRDAGLATAEYKQLPPAGRRVWVTALLLTALLISVIGGVLVLHELF